MKISFYFDPICPWCWVTSRWLSEVSLSRNLQIDWKPFSLALKNHRLDSDQPQKSKYAKMHLASNRVLRVIEASDQLGADRGKLYSHIGRAHHVDGEQYDDQAILQMLEHSNLSKDLLDAADDSSHDSALKASLDEAIDIAGSDVGVPLIIFEPKNGQKLGYFGPVLMRQPTGQAALDLWDGLSKLASSSDFYELKRSRPSGGPDTRSTT